jgi:hypothetical protein
MKMNSSIAQLCFRIPPLFLLFSCLLFPVPLFASEAENDCQIPVTGRVLEPVILRVALYPFVPDRIALF